MATVTPRHRRIVTYTPNSHYRRQPTPHYQATDGTPSAHWPRHHLHHRRSTNAPSPPTTTSRPAEDGDSLSAPPPASWQRHDIDSGTLTVVNPAPSHHPRHPWHSPRTDRSPTQQQRISLDGQLYLPRHRRHNRQRLATVTITSPLSNDDRSHGRRRQHHRGPTVWAMCSQRHRTSIAAR